MYRHSISLFAMTVAMAASATPALAAAKPDEKPVATLDEKPAAEPEADKVEPPAADIVVIGTRRTDRTLTTSASPIDVIGSTELNAQPSGNMLDVIKNIIPSFYVPQNTITDASTFVPDA